ncbi:hypothetical protein OIV83_000616 [Microbotryomycetes sp. JL201]|nr:hypothetical protein OIV83_000616 [Microbotryomycetes sp. JL201]
MAINVSSGDSMANSRDEDGADDVSMSLKIEPFSVRRQVTKDDNDSTSGQRRTIADAMFALFTGQTPDAPWPTPALCGLDVQEAERKRVWGQAMRGMSDWVTARGQEMDVHSQEPSASDSEPITVVKGFGLQVRKKATRAFRTETTAIDRRDSSRRRGVGANGGPAVLWHGSERDPDQRRGVAIIHAQANERERGFRFRMPGSATPVVEEDPAQDQDLPEEIVRTDGEEFYPLRAPDRPVHTSESLATDSEEDVLATSMEGLWVGTYGGHGLEFGHIRLVTTHQTSTDSSHFLERELEYVKVTGDANVPSGQPSWKVFLPGHEANIADATADDGEVEYGRLGPGMVETITEETFLRWCEGSEVADWDRVTHYGAGRVALSGYVNPDWTRAQFIFIKSLHKVKCGCRQDDDGLCDHVNVQMQDERVVVDEIRVRWPELGKVSCFRRVRI